MASNKGQKASVLYLFATLFNKGIAFLTVPVFTRLLPTGDYGVVTTYNSWVDILTVFLCLALYMSIRTAYVDFKEERQSFLNNVITFTLLLSLTVGAGVLFLGKIFGYIGGTIVFFAVIQGAAAALLMDYQQYLMMDLKYVQRSVFMALPNLLAVVFSIFAVRFLPFENLYMGRIVPTMLVYLAFGIIVLFIVYSKQCPCIRKKYLRYGLSISLPLVFHGIALNILSQSDRTMITVLADASQTGIYSLVYNFGMIATVLTTALDGVWLPWFMVQMKASNFQDINKRASDYIKFMTCAMFGLILVGPEILKLLAAPAYWEGTSIIPPIVLANYFIFVYTFYVNIEHYYKKTVRITGNTLIAAGVNIILNYILIPKYGYVAAAYTTLISYLIAMYLHARYSKKMAGEVFPVNIFIKPLILIALSTILYYLLIDFPVIRWIIAFSTVGVIGFFEREVIDEYVRGRKRG